VNDVLKQRLVGALILLALGVVFWPIVFVQPEEKTNVGQRSIPTPPAVATTPIAEPDPAGLRGSAESITVAEPLEDDDLDAAAAKDETDVAVLVTDHSARSVPDEGSAATEVRSEAPQRLAVDSDGVPVAWTLQVATVSSREKAEALRQRLLKKSEKAYVTSVSSGGRQLYRVCVGPKFERHELEKIQAGINTEFGVKTLLVRYTP
jgi:DedD protein